MDYLDFAIEVHAHTDGHYVVAVRSPAGEARMTAPVTPAKMPASTQTYLPPVDPAVTPSVLEQPNLLTFVRSILAHLYPDEISARRIVADVGLAADRITFSGHAANNWRAILGEAEKSGQLGAVLAVALKEYGSNQTLQAVAAMCGNGPAACIKTTHINLMMAEKMPLRGDIACFVAARSAN